MAVMVVILSVVASLITVKVSGSSSGASQGSSVYNKVISSGVIRACYVEYPPALIKDPNTGKLSGIFYDALNKAASNMSLKVDWNVEVGWADLVPSLNANKCDIIGGDAWGNSARGRSAEFSVPLYYSAINAYVRSDDNRFNGNPLIANNPQYTVVFEDGETSQVIVQQNFPNAKVVSIPQNNDVSEMLLDVVSGKADMAFQEASTANLFLKTHPGTLKNVSIKPMAVYGNIYLIKKGEFQFKSAIDNAMNELLGNGYIEQLISQYGKNYPGAFYRVASPYTLSSGTN